MSTILVYAPAIEHTRVHHPESHERMARMVPTLEQFGVLSDLKAISPVPATREQLEQVHAPELVECVQQVSAFGGGLLDHGDTYATADSYELARLAAGSCCAAVDRIVHGQAKNGIALVRPPGHHAGINKASGFCLFNNIAVAARHAQLVYDVRRVLILDFDVHHGNGTQDIFYEDNSVLFVSLHLYAPFYFYPGSGALREVGTGPGHGFTLNVPLPSNVSDEGYCRVLNQVIRPKVAAFKPDLMLVSAGFDAHWQDPLATGGLSLSGYANLARTLVEMADEWCNGRILFVLEGGYQQEALTYGVLNVVYALLGRDEIHDPLGPTPHSEQDVTDLLSQLKQHHLLI